MILDTSFLIDVLRGEDAVEERERELDGTEPAIVAAVTVMELWEGIHRSNATDAEQDRVRELLEELTHAEFGRPSAMRAGKINATLAGRGSPIDVEDVMVGAIALERDDAVLTGNPDHFRRIDGLDVESYRSGNDGG